MATPRSGYKIRGDKVPGVTTILGRFKDSGGLMYWAFNQGKLAERGIIDKLYDKADEAADIGTRAHNMIEIYINGDDPQSVIHTTPQEHRASVQLAFDNAIRWIDQTKIEIISKFQEVQMTSLDYRFGGTPDAIGMIDGKRVLLDWKTSKAVYPDYLMQLAAYKYLWEENNPDMPIDGGMYLCRFSKEFPDFSTHYYQELDSAWEQFKLYRKAYDLDKVLQQRAK